MTLSTTLPFKIGSTIYYVPAGVGTIISVSDEIISGLPCTMYGIQMLRQNKPMRVATKARALQDVADFAGANALKTVQEVLASKGAGQKRAAGHWFPKFSALEKKITTGETLAELAEAIRDLSRPVETEIPQSERPVLINAKWRLIDTLVAVTGFTEVDVLRLINQSLIDSGKNALP